MKAALIIVDMLNDFVTGELGCERAVDTIAPIAELAGAARAKGIKVIYTNDSHFKGIDGELSLWDEHAICGTKGAEVVPQLSPHEDDFVFLKRRYSGFFQTGLHLLLRELGVDTVILTGVYSHLCVRHTAADAFYWGFKIIVPKETTTAFTAEDSDSGLAYFRDVYNAELTTVKELITKF